MATPDNKSAAAQPKNFPVFTADAPQKLLKQASARLCHFD
jgi:hypothetical protein